MKKRKKKPNNSASRQQAQAKSQAAAKKRQEEDFARQLTAMFQAEQGEERAASASAQKPDSRRTRIAGREGWELPASELKAGADLQDTAYFIPGRSRIKAKPSRLASPLLQDDSPVDAEGLRAAIAATLREAGQLPAEEPAAKPAEDGAADDPRSEKGPAPEPEAAPKAEAAESVPDAPRPRREPDAPLSDAGPATKSEAAEGGAADAPRSRRAPEAPRSEKEPAPKRDFIPSEPEEEDPAAAAAESASESARPARPRWRGWLDRLTALRRPEPVPADAEQPGGEDAASFDRPSPDPLQIRFDEQTDYSGEMEPSRTPWEQDADWSDARLFRELDRALADDTYSEALSGLFRDQGTKPPAVTGPEVMAAWLSYEPEPAPKPAEEPESPEPGVSESPLSDVKPAEEPTPKPGVSDAPLFDEKPTQEPPEEPAPEPSEEPAPEPPEEPAPEPSEEPAPEPAEEEPFTLPLLPELERRRSKRDKTAPAPKLTLAADEETEPEAEAAAISGEQLQPDPVPPEPDADALPEAPPAQETAAPQSNWRKDSLPTLGELFGSLPKEAASAEQAQADSEAGDGTAPEPAEPSGSETRSGASSAEQAEGEEGPGEPILPALGKKAKQTWAAWSSALRRIREQAASAVENDVIEPASEPAPEPASQPDAELTPEPEKQPAPEAESAESGASEDLHPDPEPAFEPDAESVSEPETEPAPESDTQPDPESVSEPETEPAPESDTQPDPEPVSEPDAESASEKPKPRWRRWLSALLHPQMEELEDPEDLFDDVYDDREEGLEAEAPGSADEASAAWAAGASLDELLSRMTDRASGSAEETAKAAAQPAAGDPFLLEGLQLQEEGEQLSWADMLFQAPPAAPAAEPTGPASEPETEPVSEPDMEPASEPETEPVSEPDMESASEPETEPASEPEPEPAPEAASQSPQGAPIPEEDDFPELLPVFREESPRPSGGSALDWKTLLAAAVPMEYAEPPKSGSLRRTGRPEQDVFRDNEVLSRTAADPLEAPKPPAGSSGPAPQSHVPSGVAPQSHVPSGAAEAARPLEPAVPSPGTSAPAESALRFEDVFGKEEDSRFSVPEEDSGERPAAGRLRRDNRERAARRAEHEAGAEDRRRAPAEDSLTVPDEQSEGRADRLSGLLGRLRGRRSGASAEAEVPERPEDEAAPQPSAAVGSFQSASSEPVPSASVKRRREAEKLRPRQPEPEPEEPEEEETAYPEEACRRCARELSGVGTRLILTGLFTIISLFFTLYLSMRWSFLPEVFSGGTTVYLLLLLLAAILASDFVSIREAIRGVREKKFSPVLLILAAAFFTALDTFAAAKAVRPTFTVVVGTLLLVELWGRYDRGMAMMATLKVLREPELAAGVSEVMDTISGKRSLTRTVPDVERFMQKLETRSFLDRIMSVYTPVALAAGLVITGLVGIGLHRDLIWTGSLVFLGSVPMAGLLVFPRLFLLMANKLSGSYAALCGYHGAEAFGGEHAILIGDEDIFPAGALALNGFKVYNGSPDRLIAYAAAAAKRSGSALAPLFDDLLLAHNGRHYTVDAFRFYDSGGIGATIIGDVVLMGSLEFMRRMGVHMDKGTKVRQAVYMSVNGELAAVYAVKYNPPENLRRGLASIAGNRHFKGILVTRTFLGTPGFLKAKFGIPTGSFEYPDTRRRLRLSHAEMKRSGAQGAILAKDSFTGFAQAAAGGRVLRSATALGALLAVVSGVAGLLLMGVLASLPAYETATAVNLLFYVLAWLAPTLLLTSWARHF